LRGHCSSNIPRARLRPPSSGSQPSTATCRFAASSTSPSCAGASRAIIDLKQEIGLGHYEGGGWRGFHHHGTLSIAASGFLSSERERIPPSEPRCAARIEKSALPSGYRPRGAPDPAKAPCPQLDRNDPSLVGCRNCNDPSPVPVLRAPLSIQREAEFMMQ
jgi:hypothetical protein